MSRVISADMGAFDKLLNLNPEVPEDYKTNKRRAELHAFVRTYQGEQGRCSGTFYKHKNLVRTHPLVRRDTLLLQTDILLGFVLVQAWTI